MSETESGARGVTHNNPVNVRANNTMGVIVLGIVTIALLVALLRSQAEIRRLLRREGGVTQD